MSGVTVRSTEEYTRIAWRLIILGFLAFCLVIAGSCYLAWRVKAFARTQPAEPGTLDTYISGIEIIRAGLVQPELPTPPKTVIYQGDRINVSSTAPAGIAATVTLFDGSKLDIWPGTSLIFEKVQTTRFSSRNQEVALRLESGLVRLRLASEASQQYQDVHFSVFVQQAGYSVEQALLKPGGSYRVRLLDANAPTTSASEQQRLKQTTISEYVVEQGGITLAYNSQSRSISNQQKLEIAQGSLSQPMPAEWQVARDSNFTDFTAQEYNNNATVPVSVTNIVRADTWRVFGSLYSPEAEEDGYFYIVGGCAQRSTEQPNNCLRPLINVAQFHRDSTEGIDHTKSFRTGITQTIDLDTTAYSDLELSFTGRIYEQSLNRAGDIGEECALAIAIFYYNPADQLGSTTYCFYARDDQGPGSISNKEYIRSIKLPFRQWTDQTIELKGDLSNMRRISHLEIYANGHDYISEITNIRLVAR
ncbi:hypothetical protein [Herpetosiphon geysericola]|uniref:FecR protein domain-containing protein n=1 Tax=Herpetosiphon geysericola TaxID=70996 RepID=A0A0P6XQG5_9CHLR|nr:hypothetical protein [Herpetosiphon geysericola]KPL86216.1 hypothetical protein SE18_15350 [Herpetosiphon geysericola]